MWTETDDDYEIELKLNLLATTKNLEFESKIRGENHYFLFRSSMGLPEDLQREINEIFYEFDIDDPYYETYQSGFRKLRLSDYY